MKLSRIVEALSMADNKPKVYLKSKKELLYRTKVLISC